ncbi:hypothetical protein BH10BAC2_BH10BAC2_38610 [soil metagenome]
MSNIFASVGVFVVKFQVSSVADGMTHNGSL